MLVDAQSRERGRHHAVGGAITFARAQSLPANALLLLTINPSWHSIFLPFLQKDADSRQKAAGFSVK